MDNKRVSTLKSLTPTKKSQELNINQENKKEKND